MIVKKLRERIKSLKAKLQSETLEGTRSEERLNDLLNRIETTQKQLAEVQNVLRK